MDFIITTVAAALRVAVKDGQLLGNPADGVEPLGAGDSETREPFSAEEVQALFGAAPTREWRVLMHVAFFGGLRLMDAARLRWHNVDLLGKVVKFTPRKTSRKGRVLTIPLHPKLQAELEALPSSDDPDDFVFPELGTTVRRDLCEGFAALMDGASVARKATTEAADGRRRFFKRGFHSFRHSLVSALANKDVPPELRMKLLGHSSAAVHQEYTHTELETLATALEKIS